MRVILAPLGTGGDVNPFVGLGLALKRRGHDVVVVTNAHFESMVGRAGLGFASNGGDALWNETIGHPDMWRAQKGPGLFLRFCVECMEETFERIREANEPGSTVCAAAPQSFGARVAHDALGVPLATITPNPMLIRSTRVMPKSPLFPVPGWIGPWGNRLVYRLVELRFDRVVAPPINDFRAGRGLPPARRAWGVWRNSPQRLIGLWPDWLYGPQPDWPPQATVTGFVEYDGPPREDGEAWRPVMDGLDDPPVVFTAGTAMSQAREFFATAAETCTRLNRPGLLLAQHRDQLPRALPPRVAHVSYAPLSEALPRAAAIVHHGGIGTAARALKAGVPQLIMPMAYDQHDNAHRLGRLGVAREIRPKRFTPPLVARVLDEMLGSAAVAGRCRHHASRLEGPDGAEQTCDLIEELLRA